MLEIFWPLFRVTLTWCHLGNLDALRPLSWCSTLFCHLCRSRNTWGLWQFLGSPIVYLSTRRISLKCQRQFQAIRRRTKVTAQTCTMQKRKISDYTYSRWQSKWIFCNSTGSHNLMAEILPPSICLQMQSFILWDPFKLRQRSTWASTDCT